jgi:hypothetical protein
VQQAWVELDVPQELKTPLASKENSQVQAGTQSDRSALMRGKETAAWLKGEPSPITATVVVTDWTDQKGAEHCAIPNGPSTDPGLGFKLIMCRGTAGLSNSFVLKCPHVLACVPLRRLPLRHDRRSRRRYLRAHEGRDGDRWDRSAFHRRYELPRPCGQEDHPEDFARPVADRPPGASSMRWLCPPPSDGGHNITTAILLVAVMWTRSSLVRSPRIAARRRAQWPWRCWRG